MIKTSYLYIIILMVAVPLTSMAVEKSEFKKLMEDEWMKAVNTVSIHEASEPMKAVIDSKGAVDGERNQDGFHTLLEENPWWLVDLGAPVAIGRMVLYNRTSCQERISKLQILFSEDAKTWNVVFSNNGTVFEGGRKGTKPLALPFDGQKARFVKLQIPGRQYLHLSEVEIYAKGDDKKNVALDKLSSQSSASPWSQYTARDLNGPADPAIVKANILKAFEMVSETLAFVEKSEKKPELSAKFIALKEKLISKDHSLAEMKAIYLEARYLRRKVIFSHPLLAFDRIMINKRTPTRYSHQCDQYLGRHSGQGAGLTVISSWKDNPVEKEILIDKLPVGSTLHPDLSYDATKVMFGFCDHTEQDKNKRRFWIYEAAVDGSWVKQLTGVGNDPLATWHDRSTVLLEDWDPCYLPDGGFAFISTRCQSFGRCHGNRYTPSYMLYRANGDGSNIKQLSYGEANEWDPSVLSDGRIVYTRWDYINRHDTIFQSVWSTRQDGTDVRHFYGNNTRNPTMIAEVKAIPGSAKSVATTMGHHSYTAGSMIMIDRSKGEDGIEPVTRITPEVRFPEAEGWPVGSYSTPWPLSEELYLAAYQSDKLCHQGQVQKDNAYSIYLVDTFGGRELIYKDPEISCFAPMPLVGRPVPPIQPSLLPDAPKDQKGTFYVQNVYVSTEPLVKGSVKALRVNEILAQPARGKPKLSAVNNEILKRVLGTVPVNEDGSVMFEAPAGVPLQLQALDKDGLSVLTMRTIIYLQPGEISSCVGCHEKRQTTPPQVRPSGQTKLVKITPPTRRDYAGGFSYVKSVQPVLDRYCIRCHGLKKGDKPPFSLVGKPTSTSESYENLVKNTKIVSLAHRNREKTPSQIKDYYAHASKLAEMIMKGHKGVELDKTSFDTIISWLDLNGQFYGDYSHNRVENRKVVPEAEKALREHIRAEFGAEWAELPLPALVNYAMPKESRILNAPLAAGAGGWAQVADKGWKDTNDTGYQEMLKYVSAVFQSHESHDIAGTCGHVKGCRCGCCWVRTARSEYKGKYSAGSAVAHAEKGKR